MVQIAVELLLQRWPDLFQKRGIVLKIHIGNFIHCDVIKR